ncbi:hypothetical protein KP509_26G054000 [Ceratopteris richardii]|uniref:Choline transporter-like protein n=1 Tax=Ceratopteris richardii TaxID=49495 RepID=A0A8T2RM40_CERRI|nr:hypothetical protein KP509_26G054000 [Ceratopteris richardii]
MLGSRQPQGPEGAIVGGMDVEASAPVRKSRIVEDRRCHNLPVLFLFVAFWVGMIINSSYGWSKGDPRRLVYGLDYKGNMCGDKKGDPDLSDFDVRYWQNPNQVYDSALDGSPINLVNARSICLKDCPKPSNNSLTWVCDYPEGPINLTMQDWKNRNYDYFSILSASQQNTSLYLQGPCYPVLFESENLFWSCQLSVSASAVALTNWQNLGGVHVNQGDLLVQAVHKAITAPSAVLKRYAADLGKAWPVLVVCGGIAPLILSAVWLLIVRIFVGVVTWITVVLLNIFAFAVTVFLYIKAGWIGHDAVSAVVGDQAANDLSASTSEQQHLKVAAVVMTVIFVILVVSTIILIKRIIVAVAVIKVSAKAIGAIPSLLILPLAPFILLTIFFVYWVVAALYLFSAGSVARNDCSGGCCAYDLSSQSVDCGGCCGYDYKFTRHIALALLYHIFGCFWTTQFIIACSLTTIAGAVASYYWAQGNRSAMPLFPVLSSAKRVLKYSLGSMALGSLVVAIIETIRFILEAIRNRLRALEAAPGGCIITLFWCCGQCCLGCIEWTIKFINRNAYIVIAITGKGFCGAAVHATNLIVTNILRIGTVNIIGNVIVFLGKVGVSFASALFAFFMLETSKYKTGHDKVSSPLLPVLFCWAVGYVVASLFFAVVEMAIDTIILSFCEDIEEHNGTPIYAPPLLMQTLNRHNTGS